MSLLQTLLVIWAVVTGITLILLIYRSTLSSHEESQLYLGEKGNLIEREQQEVVKRENKIAPFLYALGTTSVVLLLSIVGLWLYRGLLMT